MTYSIRAIFGLLCATAPLFAAPAGAQTPAAPVTAVMVNLTILPGTDRAQLAATMPAEVRDTVQAYLDGKIQQWFARADGSGVVFILNSHTLDEAKAVMDALPLAKAKLANFEYTALTPLTPLARLLTPPVAAPKD